MTNFKKNIEKTKQIKIITLQEFEKEYLDFATVYSNSYKNSIKDSFRQLYKSLPKNIKLFQIDSRIIEKFIYLVYKRSQSASSLYYKTLKAAFNKASEWGYITSNPFLSVKLPKVKTKFPVFVNELELNSILIQVRENYLKSFYIVAFNTGLRAGEICSLKWDNINLSLRIITVKNTDTFTTKSKRERIIPINEVVFKELLKLKPKILNISKNDENGFVFYKQKGVQLLVDFVSKKFKRACRLAKVNEGLHLHSLRHGFASQLVKKGVSLYVVKELLGHSNLKTTEIYSHLENEDLFKAVNLI